MRGSFRSIAAGAVQQNINLTNLENLNVPWAPREVQDLVVATLKPYDETIDNCERRIRVLDEMARALYREWFVLFRYPGHEKVALVESPGGRTPKGWQSSCVGTVADDTRRYVPKGALADGPTRYVGLEHLPRRSLALNAWEETAELGSNKLCFEAGDILFGKIRPYFHKVCVAPFPGICSADTLVISPRAPGLRAFTACLVSSDEFVAHASATANGAKMPRANWKVMAQVPVAIPSAEVLAKFSAVVAPLLDEQRVLVARMHNLRQSRDLLLPRLLSGKLPVNEAA